MAAIFPLVGVVLFVLLICIIISLNTGTDDEKFVFNTGVDNKVDNKIRQPLAEARNLTSIDVKVKGTRFRTVAEINAARMLDVGDEAILVAERENPVDPNAVKVYTMEGIHIGYVEALWSEDVSARIDYIKSCTITKISKHEIPYIDLEIEFSETPVKQPDFIEADYQCRPEDQMRNLLSRSPESYKYRRVLLFVQDLYERPRAVIAKARACHTGDKIILKKGESTEYYPDRIDIYLEDGTYLGFAEWLGRKEVFTLFDSIVDSFVDSPISANTSYRLSISVLLPAIVPTPADCSITLCIYPYRDTNYPEMVDALGLVRSEPFAALDILLPIAKKEKGVAAKDACISCYYHLKQWQERIDMIQTTINHISSLTEADLPPSELAHLRNRLPGFCQQLDYSRKRLESQLKRAKKS